MIEQHGPPKNASPNIPIRRPLFPDSDLDRAILQKRAEKLAKSKSSVGGLTEGIRFIRFCLNTAEYYGIAHQFADEIIPARGLVAVPHTPGYIAGIINRRGELLTIIDLIYFFGKPGHDLHDLSKDACILVIKAAGVTAGLLVDAVEGNDYYFPDKLVDPLRPEEAKKQHFIEGIHQGRVAILDPVRLFADPALAVGKNSNE